MGGAAEERNPSATLQLITQKTVELDICVTKVLRVIHTSTRTNVRGLSTTILTNWKRVFCHCQKMRIRDTEELAPVRKK